MALSAEEETERIKCRIFKLTLGPQMSSLSTPIVLVLVTIQCWEVVILRK